MIYCETGLRLEAPDEKEAVQVAGCVGAALFTREHARVRGFIT